MSGFDVLLKSQEYAQRGMLQAESIRARMAELSSQAISQIPQQIRENQLAQAQIQSWATQRDLNLQKLRELSTIDFAEQNRLQVEGARAQVEGAQLQNQMARHQFERQQAIDAYRSPQDQLADEHAKQWQALISDPQAMAYSGLVLDPSTGRPRRGTDQELKAAVSRAVATKPLQSQNVMRDTTQNIRVELEALNAEIKGLTTRSFASDEERKKEEESLSRRRTELLNELRGVRGTKTEEEPQQPGISKQDVRSLLEELKKELRK